MKFTKIFWMDCFGCLALAGWFGGVANVEAQTPTPFKFVLDEPSKTSAGVYQLDGTLVRTLWSKQRYPAGTNSAVWDGYDDRSNVMGPGTYQIKVLQHNTEYVWDGAVGNTSAEISGPTVHTGFYPICDMAVAGTNAFYVSGYNEGMYDFRSFFTTDPQHLYARWGADSQAANIYDRNWNWTCTDGNWVYFACSAATNPNNTLTNNYPGFVVSAKVGLANPARSASFSQGMPIVNGAGTNSVYPNGVYVGSQPGLSGLAVQANGNLLAVAVAPDNMVYLLDKQSGAKLNSFSVISPGRMNFSPDGSLWVAGGGKVVHFTNLPSNPTAALTLSGFANPLAVAVNQTNPDLILVADGGNSQQIKAFNSSGVSLWTYGLAGGYPVNGVAVNTNKFWFNNGYMEDTFLSFASDGSFWVGDGGNYRALHFSAGLNYLEQIMYQPHSYVACVDYNNPTRVFNQFLEFKVDYSKPLRQGWTLVNNWQVNVDPLHISWDQGIYEVVTMTNGSTYCLIDNNQYWFAMSELCELRTNGLRFTGTFPAWAQPRGWISMGPDGSARRSTIDMATWYEATLAGFDTNNTPIYNPEFLMASAPQGSLDPVPRGSSFGNIRATVSSNNILIAFDQSLNNGYHLGGIRLGSNKWLWEASPAAQWMNGCGNYEIDNGVAYAGNTVQAIDRNIIYGYHGEFFRNAGQACQHMHFYDDGLFVGQFGECNIGHSAYEGAVPGSAGNAHSPTLTKTSTGDYYLWVNDESGHGAQRWHFVNCRNIREQMGTGTLGNPIMLTNQWYDFPSGVTAKSGQHSGEISWLPVAGAASYNIRYATMNGGPYTTVAAKTTKLDYVVGGLTNGQTYYFAVSANINGVEDEPSEQVTVNPFDTTQTVICSGSMCEGGQQTPVIDVTSANVAAGIPSYIGAEHMTATLNLRELDYEGYGNLQNESVGARGFYLSNFYGSGSQATAYAPGYNITPNYSGFVEMAYLSRQYRLDNTSLGPNRGLCANQFGQVAISVTDTNYHYLTVVSPDQFNNARQFTMSLVGSDGTTASYPVNESPGNSHVFQFMFRGNCTLQANAIGGGFGVVQGLFLDDAPITYGSVLPTISGFHLIGP